MTEFHADGFGCRQTRRSVRTAFTLVEMMLVVIIIGVLAAMVVPRLVGRTEQAKIARAKSDLSSIGLALDMYELDMGKYPETESLKALIENSGGAAGEGQWKGPYLKKKTFQDPWGHDYKYTPPSGGKDYRLYSAGPDGNYDSGDDIKNE